MLIPTILSLSQFFINNFPNISWYPYWYLGNPYHYLIGPVVPMLLGGIRVIGGIGVPLEGAYLWLIFASFILGGLGIFLLLRDWGVQMRSAILSGMLYIILPAGFFLLNYQNGLNHIALGLLPYTLLYFRRFLLSKDKSPWLLMALMLLMICIMFLTSIPILLPLVIGFIALFASVERKDDAYEKIGKTILIILLSLSLSTIWYTPKFWWVIATNPSLGGVPLGKLVWSIFQFLFQFLPLVLAIFVVKRKKYKPEGHFLFGLLFSSSFLFLSIVRFVSDPDFVMDWISFGLELQFGGAILFGSWFVNSSRQLKTQNSKLKIISRSEILLRKTTQNSKLFTFIGFIILSACVSLFIVKDLFVSLRSDYRERIINMVKKHVGEQERVFLSGSSVFFVNSKLNIQQIRGGVDQSSIHPFWAHGAYQIREGTSERLAYDWLRLLGVSYVLVHDNGSAEPFKDFKHPEKFSSLSGFVILARFAEAPARRACPKSPNDSILTKRNSGVSFDSAQDPQNDGCEDNGDSLYRVNNSSIGRVADASILSVQKPKNGPDYQAISNYILSFKRPLAVNYQKPNEIAISGNIKQGEIISLAISYDSLWQIANGIGVIASDPLGNILVIPKKEGQQRFELVYKRSLLDLAITLGLSIIIVIILVKYHKIAPYVRKRIPKLHVGLKEEED